MANPGKMSLALLASTFLFLVSCHKSSSNQTPQPPDIPPPTALNPTDPSLLPTDPIDSSDASACSFTLESKSPTQTCEVTYEGNREYTYIEGTVLYDEGAISKSSLLIDPNGIISCTGCDCLAEAKAKDATRISCANGLISPALINGHDHLTWANVKPQSSGDERFEHRNDWRGGKRGHKKLSIPSGGSAPEITYGEIRQLMVGTLSIAGSNGAPGFLRNLDNANFLEGLRTVPMDYDTFPLESGGDYDFRVDNCAYSRQPALAYLEVGRHLMHVAEGIDAAARNEFLCLSGGQPGGFDATEAKNTIVHAIGVLAKDAAEMAKDGTAVIWSPRSNIALYGNTAAAPMFKNQGVNVALGTDWVPSGSAHLLRESQCAININDKYWNQSLTDHDIWQMMTSKAASAMKVEQQLGRIATGWIADIAIYRNLKAKNVYRSIMQSEAKDTALVLRAGKVLYGDSNVMASLSPADSCAAVDVCGESKSLCYQQEAQGIIQSGMTDLAALVTKMQSSPNSYPLYFCEAPQDEPSCEPVREGEYKGIQADDLDGDGVPDSADNCPRVFNPIRPLDNGLQADADGDRIGDSCDICPLSEGDSCEAKADDDRDQDGVKDIVDNCPIEANPLQEDSDRDGSGDVCDSCALLPNPGFGNCRLETMSTFNASRDEPTLLSSLRAGAPVAVTGVVSAIGKTGYYLQDELSSAGIFVYLPKGDKPKLEQRIEVNATYELFNGEPQLTSPSIVSATEGSLLTPQPLATEDVKNPSLVGLLVSVEGKVTPVPEGGLFALDERAKVGNFFGLFPAPAPLEGDTYKVTGILRRAADAFFVEPRTPTDLRLVASGNPRVKSIVATQGFVEISSQTLPQLTLTLDRPALSGTVVSLQSSDESSLKVPATIQMPLDATSIVVPLALGTAPREKLVNITATLGSSLVEARINVAETFVPRLLNVSEDELSVWVGLESDVSLKLDFPQSFINPSQATIESNVASLVVRLNELKAGDQTLSFTAEGLVAGETEIKVSINGTSKLYKVIVRKQDLTLTEIFYDPTGEDNNLEWIEIRNTSGAPVDLSQYKIGAGGVTYKNLVYPLKGIVPANGCIVVGGPLSNEKNFAPTFFQLDPFKGGLQNGGANVDAIGLFFGEIEADSIPIDVFAYGEINKDGFIGKDGKVLTPDLTLVKSGASAERHGLKWVEQVAPTPGDCSALTP